MENEQLASSFLSFLYQEMTRWTYNLRHKNSERLFSSCFRVCANFAIIPSHKSMRRTTTFVPRSFELILTSLCHCCLQYVYPCANMSLLKPTAEERDTYWRRSQRQIWSLITSIFSFVVFKVETNWISLNPSRRYHSAAVWKTSGNGLSGSVL